jgi:hypothetical protein
MHNYAPDRSLDVKVPHTSEKDVVFLDELKEAHDHDKLASIHSAVERAFKNRIESEFVGQEITPKTRANITDFCWYLLSIAKFSGYNLYTNGFVTAIQEDVFKITNPPTTGNNNALINAVFTYFNDEGDYQLTADGFMRWDWAIAPDDPTNRRAQIMRDNNGAMPGFRSNEETCKDYHIYVEMSGQFPFLVLPIES